MLTKFTHPYTIINDLFIIDRDCGILNNELDKMLMNAVKKGVYIDLYQTALRDVTDLVENYEIPRWRKDCSGVRQLAYRVGLDIECATYELCRQLKKVTKESVIKRETDIISLSTFGKTCNRVSYASLEYYVDRSEKLWCFRSDKFTDLVKTKVNPNGKDLPSSFIRKIERRIKILKEYSIDFETPISIEEGIANINRGDIISNRRTDSIVAQMKLLYPKSTGDVSHFMTMYEEFKNKSLS